MRQLIINADDLGLCRSVNEAVERGHRQGVLTSASLMATGAAFDHAIEVIRRNPALGVGAHLCLTSGRSVLDSTKIPALVGSDQQFRHGFVSLIRLLRRGGTNARMQVSQELTAQLDRIEAAGIAIDHVNSHRHVHMIPAIREIVEDIVERRSGAFVRESVEPWLAHGRSMSTMRLPQLLKNAPKNAVLHILNLLRGSDEGRPRIRVFGILSSGKVDRHALRSLIRNLPEGTSEVLLHPAVRGDERLTGMCQEDMTFVRSLNRQAELDALTDVGTREAVEVSGTELVSFRDLGLSTANRNESLIASSS